MQIKTIGVFLIFAGTAAGCSSMPSMPALPWSSSSAEADRSAEALYADGVRYFNEKRYTRAIDSLSKIKTDYPFSPLLTDAELKIADSHYLNQQYVEAVAAFKEFQVLHPNNENIPFVIYRLGQAHFDQFTATDREQKNTEIAKGYFETVLNNYPKSPYAAPAKEKLVKCIEYLSEHEFNVANFYYQQEKYPAARDRFEEIVRKYNKTPAAEKSLFYLGESYRKDKNNVRAGLAYEALLQHYPEGKFAREAKIQLAQLDKDRQDPLAMLLMRDRRSSGAATAEPVGDIASAKEIPNLVAKTDVVYEEPGQEKGLFRRVVDKINPFGSSSDEKKEPAKKPDDKPPESALDLMAKKQAAEKESPGVFSRLWPFGSDEPKDTKNPKKTPDGKTSTLVTQLDDSLKEKGVDPQVQTAALNSSASEIAKLSNEAAKPRQATDTSKLLGDIDSSLKKSGANISELPPPPEAAEVFRTPGAAQAAIARAKPEESKSPTTSGLLSSIDQKLKTQGMEPAKFEAAPEAKPDVRPQAPKKVELEPRVAMEKGPLFLTPAEISLQEKSPQAPAESAAADAPTAMPEQKNTETEARNFPRTLVKGPAQVQASAQKPQGIKATGDEENKPVLDQLRKDIDSIGKALNPFSW